MLINHKEYLTILDEISFLKQQNQVLANENNILTQELLKQRERRALSEQSYRENTLLIETLQEKLIASTSSNTDQILNQIASKESDMQCFLSQKFEDLESGSYAKLKDIEVKNIKERLDFFEVNEFSQKMKKLFKNCTQASKLKKEPTCIDVLKWVKSLPSVSVLLKEQPPQNVYNCTTVSGAASQSALMNSSKNGSPVSTFGAEQQFEQSRLLKENKRLSQSKCKKQSKAHQQQKGLKRQSSAKQFSSTYGSNSANKVPLEQQYPLTESKVANQS